MQSAVGIYTLIIDDYSSFRQIILCIVLLRWNAMHLAPVAPELLFCSLRLWEIIRIDDDDDDDDSEIYYLFLFFDATPWFVVCTNGIRGDLSGSAVGEWYAESFVQCFFHFYFFLFLHKIKTEHNENHIIGKQLVSI